MISNAQLTCMHRHSSARFDRFTGLRLDLFGFHICLLLLILFAVSFVLAVPTCSGGLGHRHHAVPFSVAARHSMAKHAQRCYMQHDTA